MSQSTIGIYALFPFVNLHTVYLHDQREVLATQRIERIVLGSLEIIRVGYGGKDCLAVPVQETTMEN